LHFLVVFSGGPELFPALDIGFYKCVVSNGNISLLYLLQPDKNCSTFHWKYKVVWVCQSCEAKDEDEKVNVRNNVTVEIRNYQTTVQGSLDAFLSGSIRKKFCPECYRETKI
jgi:hypothetical protein